MKLFVVLGALFPVRACVRLDHNNAFACAFTITVPPQIRSSLPTQLTSSHQFLRSPQYIHTMGDTPSIRGKLQNTAMNPLTSSQPTHFPSLPPPPVIIHPPPPPPVRYIEKVHQQRVAWREAAAILLNPISCRAVGLSRQTG